MSTPSEYKTRYENITVPLETGGSVTVKVNQYRLYGANDNKNVANAFFDTLKYRGIDTSVVVNTVDGIEIVGLQGPKSEGVIRSHGWDPADLTLSNVSLQNLKLRPSGLHRPPRPLGTAHSGPYLRPPWTHWDKKLKTWTNTWAKLARLVFAGKGSPEACQAVLSLANHWGLAPDPQMYADFAMGLDCNGFVGNYLWHAQKGNPWMYLGAEDMDLGPDSPIRTGYFDHYQSHLLDRWESLDTSRMYILMEVGTDGVVINGGTAGTAGHLAITQPNERQDRPGKGGKTSFAVRVVESTASHSPGLWESWYTCVSYNSQTKIFAIHREDMIAARQQINFMIAAVS